MYVIGRPVIQFVTSSLELILLNEAPNFDFESKETFTAVQDAEVQTDENNELPSSQIDYPKGGSLYGKIVIDDLKLDVPLYFGDTKEILRVGAGQFMGSVYPGELGTTLVGGHNTDSFGKLSAIQEGTEVKVQTTYGNYTYRTLHSEVKNKDDAAVQDLISQRERRILLLYTCYPIDSLGMTDDRLFVTCELIDGPVINEGS